MKIVFLTGLLAGTGTAMAQTAPIVPNPSTAAVPPVAAQAVTAPGVPIAPPATPRRRLPPSPAELRVRATNRAATLEPSSELALFGQSDLVQALRMSTQDNVARAGDQIMQRNIDIQPTLTIRPGAPVRLVVHKDLVFATGGGIRP